MKTGQTIAFYVISIVINVAAPLIMLLTNLGEPITWTHLVATASCMALIIYDMHHLYRESLVSQANAQRKIDDIVDDLHK